MTPITATLQIEATSDWIWALFTHFAKYAEWNRLVPRIEGEPQLNGRLRLALAPASRRPVALRARVLVAARNRELRWHARSRLPKLLRVEHSFRVEQRAGNCRLHHGLSIDGWLASERLIAGLRDSFEATNAALLARAGAIALVVPSPAIAVAAPPALLPDAARQRVATTGGVIANP